MLQPSEWKVLVALLDGDTPIMDLPKKAGLGGGAVYNAVRWLNDRGLVVEQKEGSFPRRRMIKQTEKGREVANLLKQADKILG